MNLREELDIFSIQCIHRSVLKSTHFCPKLVPRPVFEEGNLCIGINTDVSARQPALVFQQDKQGHAAYKTGIAGPLAAATSIVSFRIQIQVTQQTTLLYRVAAPVLEQASLGSNTLVLPTAKNLLFSCGLSSVPWFLSSFRW